MVGNKAQKAVAAALTGMMVLGSAAPAFAGQNISGSWYRIDGSYKTEAKDVHDGVSPTMTFDSKDDVDGLDRYDTMLDAIVYNIKVGKWQAPSNVVLVSGESYADALSASALAGYFGSPIITTPAGSLGKQAAKAIRYFASQNGNKLTVWIVGGEIAVNGSVEDAVEDLDKAPNGTDEITVDARRVSGSDRSETSLAVFNELAKRQMNITTQQGLEYGDYIFVANGSAWQDALAVSSFAYRGKDAIILTKADGSLTADQAAELKEKIGEGAHVYVVGGPAQLAYDSLKEIAELQGGLEFIKGVDRYDTSKKLVEEFVGKNPGFGTTARIAVATGENWPDALIGGAFIGENQGVLVLANDNNISAVEAAVKKNVMGPANYIIGGTEVVSKDLANDIANVWFK